jgi:hypothetical protein
LQIGISLRWLRFGCASAPCILVPKLVRDADSDTFFVSAIQLFTRFELFLHTRYIKDMGAPLLSSIRGHKQASPTQSGEVPKENKNVSSDVSSGTADKLAVLDDASTKMKVTKTAVNTNTGEVLAPIENCMNAPSATETMPLASGSRSTVKETTFTAASKKNFLRKAVSLPLYSRRGGAKSGDKDGASADAYNVMASQKRSMHLSISPDDDSESMQVMLMENDNNEGEEKSCGGNECKDDDCIYTVGSVDYVVRHGSGDTKDTGALLGETMQEEEFAAQASGDGKKSKLGGFLGRGKKGGDKKSNEDSTSNNNNDGGKEDDAAGNSSNGDSGEQGGSGGGDKDDDNHNNNDESDKKDKRDNTSFDPLAYFGPHRTKFAQESTLHLHSGPESTAPTTHPSWTPVDGTEFKVRTGPNYPRLGKKDNSKPSLYEVYSVRFFRSGKRTVGGATRIMPLPEMVEGVVDGVNSDAEGTEKGTKESKLLSGGNSSHLELKGTKIPDVLVVHFMLPYEPPNMFKQKDDGQGGECVYYLRPSQRFLDEVAGRTPSTAATQLFIRWCNECHSNPDMRARFKCMALVRDIEKHNFGLLKSYNGKPVLITESGRVCSGYHGDTRYLEMTANGKRCFRILSLC